MAGFPREKSEMKYPGRWMSFIYYLAAKAQTKLLGRISGFSVLVGGTY